MTAEREITEPVDLARGARLNPEAVGWSRTPLHRTSIDGWGRTKRWEYWGIVTDRWVVGLTVAGLDYLALAGLYVLDRATGELISAKTYVPNLWATEIDMKTGRPIVNPQAYITTTPQLMTPTWMAAHTWHPMSYYH